MHKKLSTTGAVQIFFKQTFAKVINNSPKMRHFSRDFFELSFRVVIIDYKVINNSRMYGGRVKSISPAAPAKG